MLVVFRTIAVHLDFKNILKNSNQVFLAGTYYIDDFYTP